MVQWTLREMIGTRRAKVGTFVIEFCTPGIGQILKAAGSDYAVLDMEHSDFGIDTVKQMLRYMEAGEMPTIVRVPSRNYHHVARALDMGAEGIMLPMVGSAEEARAIVAHAKYPPDGHRGVALQVAHDRYQPGPVLNKLRDANRKTTLFAQIETRSGVNEAEAIAALDGIDCLWIGQFDLSASLGIAGQFNHATYLAAEATVQKACAKHMKSFGRLAPDVATGIAKYQAGFDFICYSGDSWLLRDGLKRALDALCDECRPTGVAKRTRAAQGRRDAGGQPAK